MGKGGDPNYFSNQTAGSEWSFTPQQFPQFQQVQDAASAGFRNQKQYYPGSTVAAPSAATRDFRSAGQGLIEGAGQGPAQDYNRQVLGGAYLGGSPFLDQQFQQGAEDITRQFRTAAMPGTSLAAYGRGGSGAEMNRESVAYRGLGDALSRNYTNTYGRNYEIERGYQNQAVGNELAFNQDRRTDLSMGGQIGMGTDIYNQNVLSDEVNRFRFGQDEFGNRTDEYIRQALAFGLLPGSTSSFENIKGRAPQQPQGSPVAQGIGLGLQTIGTGAMIFG